MKKTILSLVLLVSFSLISFGQSQNESTTKTNFKYQLGMNVGPLVKSLLNKGNISNNLSQGYITFKSINKNAAFRSGIGFQFQKNHDDDGSSIENIEYTGTLWLGGEKHKKLTEKWECYIGAEARLSTSRFRFFNGSGDDPSTNTTFSISPLFGIQYRLTPRLILQTEAKLNFYYTQYKNTFVLIEGPIFIDPFFASDSKWTGVSITLPNILNLVVEF